MSGKKNMFKLLAGLMILVTLTRISAASQGTESDAAAPANDQASDYVKLDADKVTSCDISLKGNMGTIHATNIDGSKTITFEVVAHTPE
jgi:hypothetical protein